MQFFDKLWKITTSAARLRRQQILAFAAWFQILFFMGKDERRSDVVLRMADLFCGAGGLSLGFTKLSRAHYETLWAADHNPFAVESYRANFADHCELIDIRDLITRDVPKIEPVDILIGGPPCQGFSLLNKKKQGDPRREFWSDFLAIASKAGASMFLMENVVGLLGSSEHDALLNAAEEQGYQTVSSNICAADYGVAQVRRRAFIFGARFPFPSDRFPPPPTHHKLKEPAWRTVRDAIADLDPPEAERIGLEQSPYDLHVDRKPTELSKLRYRAIPEEGMNRIDLRDRAPELTPPCWMKKKSGGTDLFGRLWWDRPSVTIRTEFFKPEKGRYLHPEQHRPLTLREAARLQSFPDDFIFCGSRGEIARQIGNAVPPLLAAHIADAIYDIYGEFGSDLHKTSATSSAKESLDQFHKSGVRHGDAKDA